MGKVVLIASGKGGVGKTTLATNIGTSLVKRGAKVLIVDMNMGLRNDDIYLGLENRILFDLGDVISGLCVLDKAVVHHDFSHDLSLLSCPQYRDIAGLTSAHIRALYAKVKKENDIVLVDIPVLSGSQLSYISTGADEALVVTTQDYSSVRSADAVNRRLASDGIFQRYYVVNMVQEQTFKSEELPDLSFIDKNIAADCAGIIPWDLNIHYSNNQGVPISMGQESYISSKFDEIALRIL